jgi:hypothetical protein
MSDIPNFYVDLSGMFNIQKNFIKYNVNRETEPTLYEVNNNISSGLTNIYKSYFESDRTVNNTLEHQKEVLDIVNKEQDRLNTKKDQINQLYEGKQRALVLNESYRLRYKQILKIILVVIITLVLFIIVTFISKSFPDIPVVFEFISIIIVSTGIILVYFMTVNLLSRSNVYYNELVLPGPGVIGNAVVESKTYDKNITDLLRDLDTKMCIGSSCCDVGTHYDSGNGVCAPGVLQGFTTIDASPINRKINIAGLVMPNSPNEFSEYTLIR